MSVLLYESISLPLMPDLQPMIPWHLPGNADVLEEKHEPNEALQFCHHSYAASPLQGSALALSAIRLFWELVDAVAELPSIILEKSWLSE